MGMALTVPRYSVQDLEHFPDDGNRYELLDGELLVTPSPRVVHQGIATQLAHLLMVEVQDSGHGRIFAPGVVVRPPKTQLQPDVLVVPARFSMAGEWTSITEHWLAVEVLSRSSRVYDREFKRDAYLALGVREVWLVDVRDKFVEVCRAPGAGVIMRDEIVWRVPDIDLEVVINLNKLFADLP